MPRDFLPGGLPPHIAQDFLNRGSAPAQPPTFFPPIAHSTQLVNLFPPVNPSPPARVPPVQTLLVIGRLVAMLVAFVIFLFFLFAI